jgi:hypothetical protein
MKQKMKLGRASLLCLVLILSSCGKSSKKNSELLQKSGSYASPTSITLVQPSTSAGEDSTPTIQVGGVKAKDSVKIYTDSSCSNEVASGEATTTSINLTTKALTQGHYTFYARRGSWDGVSSCSSVSVSYSYIICPNNFVLVHKNTDLGTSLAFCVSKYEMKCSGTQCSETLPVGPGVNASAVSSSAGKPWIRITQAQAQTACKNLGAKYDLISNPEWMTIAQEVENVVLNWSSGVIGTGAIFRGHSDGIMEGGVTGRELEASTDNSPYHLTGNSETDPMGSGKEQKRTLKLLSEHIIWDFSGNIWEWINWDLGDGLMDGPTTCAAGVSEIPALNCNALLNLDYMPGNPAEIDPNLYNSNYGLGKIIGGNGGGTIRGGISSGGTEAGIFSLDLEFQSNIASRIIGFRCVYRP